MSNPASRFIGTCLVFLALSSGGVLAQDSATVYFYRPRQGGGVAFSINHKERFLNWISRGIAIRYVCTPGQNLFLTKSEKGLGGNLTLSMKPGEIYYVKATTGYQSEEPGLQQMDAITAQSQMESMRIEQITNLAPTRTTKADTLAAVDNLFYRKRRVGSLGLTIFGSLAGGFVVTAGGFVDRTTYSVSNGTVKTSHHSDEQAVSVFLGLSLTSGVLAIAAGAQLAKSKRTVQTRVVEDYKNGKPLPPWSKQDSRTNYFICLRFPFDHV